eukprot:c12940_g1_i3.p2 GENE.c12940_g1_i3~~c12940_g1_i3.p2  ORF type:complete len:151 (+),score=50.37 c12940_g1_i3:43-453(+)
MAAFTNMRMKKMDTKEEIGVTRDDQKSINRFGRLNTVMHDLEDTLKVLEQDLERLDDGNDELILVDDDESVMYSYGESFLALSKPECEAALEHAIEQKKRTRDDQQAQLLAVQDEMKRLKTSLYAKFKDNIYLEED